VVARPVEQLLSPLHRDRTLARNECRQLDGRVQRRRLALVHAVDEAHAQRLVGAEYPCCEWDLLDPAVVPNNLGQPAQRAHVGREPDINFLHSKPHVPRAHAHVGRRGQVDTQAEREAVQNRNDGLLAALDGGDAVLELVDVPAQLDGAARGVRGVVGGRVEEGLGRSLHVEAGRKCLVAGTTEDDGADRGIMRELGENTAQFEPHPAGRHTG